MSFKAATTCEQSVFEYCNYGFDTAKYKSSNHCYEQEIKKCKPSNTNNMRTPQTPTDQQMKRYATSAIILAIGFIVAIRAKKGFWVGAAIVVAFSLIGTGIGIFAFPDKDKPTSQD